MDNQIMQPYELSIWEDIAPEDGSTEYLDERKIAVIATNGYDAQIRAFNVTLKETITGEKTLTFEILRRYRDAKGELLDNPFIPLLTNERKIKLRIGEPYSFYDEKKVYRKELAEKEDTEDKWLDFIIKIVDESKKDEKNTYTCKELFTTELGKNGYAITLADELENNYGTLNELANRILQNSGWTVGSSYIPKEYHAEQLFKLYNQDDTGQITLTQMIAPSGSEPAKVSGVKVADLYFFASDMEAVNGEWHLKNSTPQVYYKNGGFIIDDADDDRIIIDPDDSYNYISSQINITTANRIWVPVKSSLKGRKIIDSNKTHYESIADKYVTDYNIISDKSGGTVNTTAYGYEEIEYLTSQTVQNYVVNGSNMSSTLGWMAHGVAGEEVSPYDIITYPKNSNGTVECSKNYLAVKPQKKKITYLFNVGLNQNNFKIIKGDKYILRVKARRININSTMSGRDINEIDISNVTKWKKDGGSNLTIGISNWTDLSAAPSFIPGMFRQMRHWDPDPQVANNADLKRGEYLTTRGYNKVLASKEKRHRYTDGETTSWWSDEQGYIWCVFEAPESYGSSYKDHLGLLIQQPPWTGDKYCWCFEDIQFYPYMEQTYNDKTIPIFLNDIPSAAQLIKHNFYKIIDGVRRDLASNPAYYEVRKRENYESVRHLEVSKSNYFNNINTLAELFEVWVGFKVAHRRDGKLLMKDGKYVKQVIFSKYSPFDKENWAGFKYGINVEDIKRNTVSDQIATRTIVNANANEFATDGYCTIVRAIDNPSKENVIYNFDYYINQGLLDSEQVYKDFWGSSTENENGLNYYNQMNSINTELIEINEKIQALLGDLDINEGLRDEWTSAAEELGREIKELEEELESLKKNHLENESLGVSIKSKLVIARNQLNQIQGSNNTESELNKVKAIIEENKKALYGTNGESGSYKSFWDRSISYSPGDIVRVEDTYYKAKKQAYKKEVSNSDYWKTIKKSTVVDDGLVNKSNVLLDDKKRIELKLFQKYNRYIQEGTWESNDYVDDNLYYIDAKKVSNQSAFPKVTYTLSVVDIGGIKKYAGYTFSIGERTYLEDTEFFGWVYKNYKGEATGEDITWKTPYRKEVVISERTRNFDDPSKSTITIQTYRNQWKDLFSKLTAATQALTFASGGYQRAANLIDESGQLKTSKVAAAFAGAGLNIVSNTEGVKITSGEIEVKNLTKITDRIKITGSGIKITNDGGRTYKTAIDANGINTSLLVAQQIDADLINITSSSSNYAFTWNKEGLNAFLRNASSTNKGTNGNVFVRFNNLGIFGTSKGEQINNVIQQNPNANELQLINAIKDYTTFFLTWDGLYLNSVKGRVRLDPTTGLEIYGTNYWPNNTLSTYDYVFDADGTKYTNKDFIPLVSLGRQGLSYSGKGSKYGLRLRNNQGYITMETANDGNLLLRNQLQVGFANEAVSYQKEIQELVFVKKSTKVVQKSNSTSTYTETTYTVLLNQTPVDGTKIRLYRTSNTNNEITWWSAISGVWTRTNLSDGSVKYTVKKANDKWNMATGYYLATYTVNVNATPYVGINGDGKTDKNNPIPLVLYAGYNANSNNSLYYADSPFRLYADGSLIANSAEITGHINATSGIFSGAVKVGDTAGINGNPNAEYVFYAGDGTSAVPNFYVTPTGEMYGNNVHVTNGYFKGEITATTGTLKRLYFEEDAPFNQPTVISYIGLGDAEGKAANMIYDNRIFINIRGLNFVVDGMGNLFGETAYLSKNHKWDLLLRNEKKDYPNIDKSDKLKQLYNIIINGDDGNVLTVYNPKARVQDINDTVLEVTDTGDIEMAGTLRAKNLFLKGNMLVSNGTNSILINGETGEISGQGKNAGWWISADGDAEFENITVRGTLAATVFEFDKITALGGIFAITPSIFMTEDAPQQQIAENIQGFIIPGMAEAGTWKEGDRILVNFYSTETKSESYCYGKVHIYQKNSTESIIYITLGALDNQQDSTVKEITAYITEELGIDLTRDSMVSSEEIKNMNSIPANTIVINTNLDHNSILLSSKNENGSTIYMTAKDKHKNITMMGYLDGTKISNVDSNGNPNLFREMLGPENEPQYGFYSDNAYLEGKVYLPSAGITNENEYIANDAKQEYGFIRMWAGASAQEKTDAPFMVTSKGYLFANHGYFSGKIAARNSEFSGVLKATGVILGPNPKGYNEVDTLSNFSHFYFGWADKAEDLSTADEEYMKEASGKDVIKRYILDINNNGVNLWNNLTVFSRYYSGYYKKNDRWEKRTTWNAKGFSRYAYDANTSHSYRYWPNTNNPYPLFTFIDTGNEITVYPRPVSMRLQLFAASDNVFNTSNGTDLYGMNFDGDKLKFVHTNVTGKVKFEEVAQAMWDAQTSFTIGHTYMNGKDYVGVNASEFSFFNEAGSILDLRKDSNTNIITMGSKNNDQINFGENVRVTIKSKGIAFNYLG